MNYNIDGVCAVVDVLELRLYFRSTLNWQLHLFVYRLPWIFIFLQAPIQDKYFKKFKGTASPDWVGPCIVLMDRPLQLHLSR
jgi:hypothetical protein